MESNIKRALDELDAAAGSIELVGERAAEREARHVDRRYLALRAARRDLRKLVEELDLELTNAAHEVRDARAHADTSARLEQQVADRNAELLDELAAARAALEGAEQLADELVCLVVGCLMPAKVDIVAEAAARLAVADRLRQA